MVSTNSINNCCSAKILVGFGPGRSVAFEGTRKPELEGMKEDIISKIAAARMYGDGMLIAFTNEDQKIGMRALRSVGFKPTKYAKTGKHKTKIRLWHLNVFEWRRENVK